MCLAARKKSLMPNTSVRTAMHLCEALSGVLICCNARLTLLRALGTFLARVPVLHRGRILAYFTSGLCFAAASLLHTPVLPISIKHPPGASVAMLRPDEFVSGQRIQYHVHPSPPGHLDYPVREFHTP